MEYNYNYNQFLLDLDLSKNKTIYAKITALTFDERPIETIEGRVTGGSVSIDGASALRRACSLTLTAQNYQSDNFYWGLNTKFKLEIGVENTINPLKPKIIWFKQGIFILTSFNTSHATNNLTISLQGKDKMVLLNGEVGGSLTASVDFGNISEEIDGSWVIRKIPIYDIIKNAVHVYAGEPFHNIVINDLDTYGVELLEYRYDIPMYLYRRPNEEIYKNVLLENDTKQWYYYEDKEETKRVGPVSLKEIPQTHLDQLVDPFTGTTNPLSVYLKEEVSNEVVWTDYILAKVEYGQTAGYRSTDLVYAGELIGNVGESLTSILDKIRNMLTEFEYFYNVDGQFVFQKKQSFISTLWSPTGTNEEKMMTEALAIASNYAYRFSDNELITAFNNNPNLLNLRNDFSIWGERESISGEKIPVHLRYAIDEKPVSYTTTEGIAYDIDSWDWREIIYRMAEDYYKHNTEDDFELRLIKANGSLYPNGRTGYENYYTDIQGFWRQLYNPNPKEEEKDNYYDSGDNQYWNKTVFTNPHLLNFWFDFLDVSYGQEMAKYSVKAIGARTKSVNDTSIKSIYFRDTPKIIFVNEIKEEDQLPGYRYIQVGPYESIFSISAQGKSAKDKLDELLYQHSYCIESASITSIPVYYLDVNTRVYIEDRDTNLQGDYIISKITVPLTYNGTMSITASKAAENII